MKSCVPGFIENEDDPGQREVQEESKKGKAKRSRKGYKPEMKFPSRNVRRTTTFGSSRRNRHSRARMTCRLTPTSPTLLQENGTK